MPILEILAGKGLIALYHLIVAEGSAVAVSHAAVALIGQVGLGTFLSGTFIVGVVAGGIVWTKERVDNLINGISALQKGDVEKAIKNFGQLVISGNLDIDDLPDAAHDYLIRAHLSETKATDVAKIIKSMESDIANEVRRFK